MKGVPTMNKTWMTLFTIILVFSFSGFAFTQGKSEKGQKEARGQAAKEEMKPLKKMEDSDTADTDKDVKRGGTKGQKAGKEQNKGNAYGKDKEVDGKEFGQSRARAARSRAQQRLAEVKSRIELKENRLAELKARLEAAKEKLAMDRKSGRINAADSKIKEERIRMAEEKLAAIEARVAARKTRLTEDEKIVETEDIEDKEK